MLNETYCMGFEEMEDGAYMNPFAVLTTDELFASGLIDEEVMRQLIEEQEALEITQ